MTQKKSFVIMSFDPAHDRVYHQAIKPALGEKGYRCRRADEDPEPGNIPAEIIRSIIDADVVVADISDPRPNVMYETAVSHCTGNKTITIGSETAELPFDIASFRVVKYNSTDDGLRLLKFRLKDALDTHAKGEGQVPTNLVQDAGRDYFDLRSQIRDNLRAIVEERDRMEAFSQFVDRGGKPQDNTLVADSVARHLIGSAGDASHPVLASICGAGAAGKSTFSTFVSQRIVEQTGGELSVEVVPTDSYQYSRAERSMRNVIGFSPDGHDLNRLVTEIESLLVDRHPILITPYNHRTGGHDEPREVVPTDILILEGVHSFYPRLAPFGHGCRYYIYADKEKAKEHKFVVDLNERGYDIQQAFKHAESEYAAYEEFVLPLARLADYVIEVDQYWKYTLPTRRS